MCSSAIDGLVEEVGHGGAQLQARLPLAIYIYIYIYIHICTSHIYIYTYTYILCLISSLRAMPISILIVRSACRWHIILCCCLLLFLVCSSFLVFSFFTKPIEGISHYIVLCYNILILDYTMSLHINPIVHIVYFLRGEGFDSWGSFGLAGVVTGPACSACMYGCRVCMPCMYVCMYV